MDYGTSSGTYPQNVDVGNVLTATVSGLTAGQTSFFVVRADNAAGESGNANEVSEPAGDWQTLTASVGTIGVRLLNDSVVGAGTPTSVPFGQNDPIPSGGFNPVAGKFIADMVDTSQKTTLADGQYTVWETRLECGAPAVSGDQYQLKYRREDGSDFDSYGDSLKTMTLTAPPSPLGLRGVTTRGGTFGGQED